MVGEGRAGRVPTVTELRAVVQPPSVTGRDVEHWTAGLYLRRLSPYVTRVLLAVGLSANAVTWLMIATGVLAGVALLVGGVTGALLAVLLGQLQMLWDCCDGEVARWTGRTSVVGVFLDRIGHYAAELSLCVLLGVRVARGDDPAVAPHAVALGAFLALLVLLNRAVNDMVHASRAVGGLPPLGTVGARSAPRAATLARLRSAARVLPVHRALHSVELTFLVLAAAVADAVTGRPVTAWLLVLLVPAAAFTVVGHVTTVLTSQRLR